MIKTLIIEDEQPAALRLEKLLKGIDHEIDVIGILDTAESAIRWFESHTHPDLIMLDIQLGDGLSFNIFNKVKVESYVIFTTAYDEYAIRAFELNSIDYLLKPVNETRLSQSIAKFRKFSPAQQNISIRKLLETIENRDSKYKKRFVVTITGKIKVVETENVAFFYSKEKNTFLCSADKRHYPVEFSLDQLESILNPELFIRVNRQYIVQYKSISKIDILSKSRIRIETAPSSDEEILVSSSRTSDFRNWLER
jgi:two-component system, LytTR family, response regulator LytT